MTKKQYEVPEIKLVNFESADVIMTSLGEYVSDPYTNLPDTNKGIE